MSTAPERMRALLAKPGFIPMPAVWDGLTAQLAAKAGFETAFLSGSCCAASRLGGPDLDLISFAEMFDSFNMVRQSAPQTLVLADGDHGYGNPMNVMRTVKAYGRAGAAARDLSALYLLRSLSDRLGKRRRLSLYYHYAVLHTAVPEQEHHTPHGLVRPSE